MPFALLKPEQRWQTYCASLPDSARDAVLWLCNHADQRGLTLYAVGGYVRDLVLETRLSDIDLVVEGDALMLARDLAAHVGGILHTHEAFGTATVMWHETSLDLITARREVYPYPAALPIVTPSNLADDLARRDFTINTLALQLNGDQRGSLIDQHDALADLHAKVIRVLHHASFVDDPTRMLRAVRFAARLNFQIEEQTLRWLHEAVATNMIQHTTPIRIWHELALLLQKPHAAAGLDLAYHAGILRAIHPHLRWNPTVKHHAEKIITSSYPSHEQQIMLWLLLTWDMAEHEYLMLGEQFNLPKHERQFTTQIQQMQQLNDALNQADLSDGTLDALLHGMAEPVLRVAAVQASERIAQCINHYLDVLRHVPSATTGDDLKRQGIPPSPIYKALLAEARRRQLDENIEQRA